MKEKKMIYVGYVFSLVLNSYTWPRRTPARLVFRFGFFFFDNWIYKVIKQISVRLTLQPNLLGVNMYLNCKNWHFRFYFDDFQHAV